MTAFFLSLWLAVTSFLGFSSDVQDHVDDHHDQDNEAMPQGNPGQSAPQQTINACIHKTLGETCTFSLNGPEMDGVCSQSGEDLACGPTALQPIE